MARRAFHEVGHWMGVGIDGLVDGLNPEMVLLGGLLAQMSTPSAYMIAAELEGRALAAPREDLEVRPTRLGADAPLLGAAELTFKPLPADPAAIEP